MFHNGHKLQIEEVKKHSDAVVAVMSGSLVQRGDVAITDKWSRAKSALLNGADLVLELPVCYALNAAQNFATGAVNTLNALGITDSLCFGSECGSIDTLYNAAELLENESEEISQKIKSLTADGMSYASALTKAYSSQIDASILKEPNNILAIEYIRAIIRTDSKIKPFTIKRHKAGYHDKNLYNNIASASKLREMLINNEDISDYVPYSPNEINCDMPYLVSRLDNAVISHLRCTSTCDLKNINEVSEGIENRISAVANTSYSFDTLVDGIKNKRYTSSKIRRIILASLIGFTKDIYTPYPEYIRVLGMNKTGMAILKEAKGLCKLPIITKTADYKGESKKLQLDCRATDIAMLCNPNPEHRLGGMDFKTSPIILK